MEVGLERSLGDRWVVGWRVGGWLYCMDDGLCSFGDVTGEEARWWEVRSVDCVFGGVARTV